jgi:hypothetical protein
MKDPICTRTREIEKKMQASAEGSRTTDEVSSGLRAYVDVEAALLDLCETTK